MAEQHHDAEVMVPCPPTIRALTHALAPQGYCPAHRDPKFVREGVVTQGAIPDSPCQGPWVAHGTTWGLGPGQGPMPS